MLSSKYTAQILQSNGIDLTPEEAVILDQLCELGRQTQRNIGAVVAKGPSSVSRYIDSLHSKGYVQRETDDNDRRNTWISATSQGHAARSIVTATGLPQIDLHMSPVSEADFKIAARVLDTIIITLGSSLDEVPKTEHKIS